MVGIHSKFREGRGGEGKKMVSRDEDHVLQRFSAPSAVKKKERRER